MKTTLLLAAAVALGLLALMSQRPPPESAAAPSIDLHRLVESGALLLDVRTPEEFNAGHLPKAVNIPVSELMGRLGEVGDPARPVVVYCASGTRSSHAARMLAGAGWKSVHDLGPMSAW